MNLVNQRGSMVVFLAALPILLTLIAGSVVASVFAYQISSVQDQCYRTLYDIQRRQLRLHRKLLALNVEASRLRLQRTRANAAVVATSGNPAAQAAARAVQLAVVAKQIEFRTRQSLLHNEVLIEARHEVNVAKGKLSNFSVTARVVKAPTSPFRDSPVSSLSPDKVYAYDAEEKQRAGFSWLVVNPLGDARELIRISGAQNKIHGKCDVSIAKKGGLWVPVISGDRS